MRRSIINLLFAAVMVVMAVILAVAATLICTVKLLHPQRLTPLVLTYANQMLDADVSLGKVELSFDPTFPFLKIQVDSLAVVSHAFDNLPATEREELPVWSDSLISIDRFSGSINVGAFLRSGEIAIHDVEIVRPGVNVVLTADGIANFDIYHSTDTALQAEDDTPLVLPPISIDRFAFVEPREIRYFNALDSTAATVLLLHDVRLEKSGQPAYSIRIDGHLASPLAKAAINIDDLSFGLDGRVKWNPGSPYLLTLEEFKMRGAFLSASLGTSINLDSTLTVSTAKLEIDPIKISEALTLLPDSLRRANKLIAPYFTTDGAVSATAELLQPFVPSVDTIPAVAVNVSMPDCQLTYGKADFKRLGFDVNITTVAGNLDKTLVEVKRFDVAGPATSLSVKGSVTDVMSDPSFRGSVNGNVDIRRLPPIVADLAQGFLSGNLQADIELGGRVSMFAPNEFHKLDVHGSLKGNDLFYLSNDTAKMVEIHRAQLLFGSKYQAKKDSTGALSDPMLAGSVKIDTATVLIDGVDICVGSLALGVGVDGSIGTGDSTDVIPLGGGLHIGRLNVESITDSAGMRARDLGGQVRLRRFKGDRKVPEILANLEIGRMAVGAPGTRFVLSKAQLNASTYKLPMPKRSEAARKVVDSLKIAHPDLSPDSVMKLALEKRLAKRHKGKPRVASQLNDEDIEMLDWNLSKGFTRFLLGWRLDGTLSTRNARLFTPLFPLRNRISRLDIAFSNDSVSLRSLRYKAGSSDLSVTGLISNIKRGLTSKLGNNTLKVNFAIESDTIDVNQLAAATFAGAAYAERIRKGDARPVFGGDDDDSTLDRQLESIASEQPDTVGPLLIPVNVDGQLHLKANNIMYADLAMTDMHGDILVFDGGVNLHDLSAASDAGAIKLSALYSAPKADDMHFGFGLDLERINIERFLRLVPAVDSVLPIMRDFRGIIDAEMAATVDIDSAMNLVLPTLDAAVRLTADSLAFINAETYATLGKWLRFRDRADNTIKHMNVEMIVRDDVLQIFPFAFDIDRYRLGIAGYNDLNLNFDYHISVLKSPIPFKFGITIKFNPDKFKVRFGGAKYKEGQVVESVGVVDTARVNLLQQLEGVFRRGVRNSRFSRLKVAPPVSLSEMRSEDPGLSAADSLALIKEGLIEAPKPQNEVNSDDK